jgi:hypothetical protein
MMDALPAFDEFVNLVSPSVEPLTAPPWLVICALPAVEVSENSANPVKPLVMVAGLLVIIALLAVEVLKKCVIPPSGPLLDPPLSVIVAWPAFELLRKSVSPLDGPAVLVSATPLPTVALLEKTKKPRRPEAGLTAVMKFCVLPELLMIPAPLMVRVNPGLAMIAKLLAPAPNVIVLTWVLAEMETPVVADWANVAALCGLLGTTGGAQFMAVFQSPLIAFGLQVALPPWTVWRLSSKMKVRASEFRIFDIGTNPRVKMSSYFSESSMTPVQFSTRPFPSKEVSFLR